MVWTPEKDRFAEDSGSSGASSRSSKRPRGHFHLRDALLDSLSEAMVAIDREGRILESNEAWERFNKECSWLGEALDAEEEMVRIVLNEAELKQVCEEADVLLTGVRCVVKGGQSEFKHEFSMHHAGAHSWFRLWVKKLPECPNGSVMVSLRDITVRRKTEQDLRESHSLFRRIIEGTGDGIFIYDLDGRILMNNTAGAELVGFKSAEMVGKSIEEVFPPEIARTVRGQSELVLATGRTIGYELVLNSPKGTRTALVQKGIYRNHRNEAVGLIAIARDITERKQAEERLIRSEHHFRALIEKSADCILLLSEDGTILYASPPSKEISGYESEELKRTSLFFWIHPSELSLIQQRFGDLLELPGASICMEFRHLCKDGQWKWMEATATNLLHDPSVYAIVFNGRDISERKGSEQELRQFKAIIESSIDGIISVDLEGKITSWNPAAQNIFGYSEAEILGKDCRILVAENRLAEIKTFTDAVMRGKGIDDFQTARIRRDGRRVDISLSLSPIRKDNQRLCGCAIIVRDITERRRLEREVLEISDFEKHRIGQDLHDDLCQHLVGISMIGNLLYAELTRLGLKQADDAKQVTDMIRTAVDHARILAKGLSPLNIANAGLGESLQILVSNTEQLFRVPCFFECNTPLHIEDSEGTTHFYRIAQEALHNAVKHSKGTKVVVRLEEAGDAILVTVRDDGVGPPDSKKRSAGTGLGMHTMHYRARIIGATLEISRNAEGGTSVICRLPKQKDHPAK